MNASVPAGRPLVVAIVGIDGCGKSSVFRAALERLGATLHVAGVGDATLSALPGQPLRERADIPLSRSARVVGGVAKRLRRPGLYKNVKFLELTERTRIREYLASQESPDAILTDGEPLINAAAWAVARYYRAELAGDDATLDDALARLTGEQVTPLRRVPAELRRSWQLVALERLRLGRFREPDLVFLLEIAPATAMARIRARGRPLQAHETEPFLAELARGYERVCLLLQQRHGVPVVRLNVDQLSADEAAAAVAETVLARITRERDAVTLALASHDRIEVIATTMSGSLKDQRKVGRIAPEFRARTSLPVIVHPVDSHPAAREAAHEAVAAGCRTLVSAGGAGTCNAVLEGAHLTDGVPPDLRLAFLRKGSADLVGKALRIPDDLTAAVAAIVDGLERDRTREAAILAIEAAAPDGTPQRRHLLGFGGFALFGDVPRFTETRIVKYYKGVLGTLFGDLGPFYTGLLLASVYWRARLLAGRVPKLALTLDGRELPPEHWGAVVVINGDLGKDFPLGRGLDFAGDGFRVVALRYRSLRRMPAQINACRTGAVIERPEEYDALVREVRELVVTPVSDHGAFMVNVDGLRMLARGTARVTVSGRVTLVEGPALAAATATVTPAPPRTAPATAN